MTSRRTGQRSLSSQRQPDQRLASGRANLGAKRIRPQTLGTVSRRRASQAKTKTVNRHPRPLLAGERIASQRSPRLARSTLLGGVPEAVGEVGVDCCRMEAGIRFHNDKRRETGSNDKLDFVDCIELLCIDCDTGASFRLVQVDQTESRRNSRLTRRCRPPERFETVVSNEPSL